MHIHVSVDASLRSIQDIVAKKNGPKGLKATAIHLWREGLHQLDVMFTLHVRKTELAVAQAYCKELVSYCQSEGLLVLRTKIEADLSAWKGPVLYYEIHTRSPNLHGSKFSPQSENLLQSQKGLFMTERTLSQDDAFQFAEAVRQLDPESEIWLEAVLQDTAPEMDAWWCGVRPLSKQNQEIHLETRI